MRAGPTENGELRVQGPLVRSFGCLAPINRKRTASRIDEYLQIYLRFTWKLPRKPRKSLDLRAPFESLCIHMKSENCLRGVL